MANEVLKRFVNEEMKRPDLYDYYLQNPLVIQERFQKFFHMQEANNRYFAKVIESRHLVKSKDEIIETVLNMDMDGISDYLKNSKKIKIQSGYGTIKVPTESLYTLSEHSCYITNGVYHDTREIIYNITNYVYGTTKPSFIIGVVDRPCYEDNCKTNSEFYETNLEKIKNIQKELHKRKIKVSTYKENREKASVYLLVHRGDRV